MTLAVITTRLNEVIAATSCAARLFNTTNIFFRTAFLRSEVITRVRRFRRSIAATSFGGVVAAAGVSATGFSHRVAAERVVIRIIAAVLRGGARATVRAADVVDLLLAFSGGLAGSGLATFGVAAAVAATYIIRATTILLIIATHVIIWHATVTATRFVFPAACSTAACHVVIATDIVLATVLAAEAIIAAAIVIIGQKRVSGHMGTGQEDQGAPCQDSDRQSEPIWKRFFAFRHH
jgi:hypothetical protein